MASYMPEEAERQNGLLMDPTTDETKTTLKGKSLKELKQHFGRIKQRALKKYQKNSKYEKVNTKKANKAARKAAQAFACYKVTNVTLDLIEKSENGVNLTEGEQEFLLAENMGEIISAQEGLNNEMNETAEEEFVDVEKPSGNENASSSNMMWYPTIGMLPPPPTPPIFSEHGFPESPPESFNGCGHVCNGLWKNGALSKNQENDMAKTTENDQTQNITTQLKKTLKKNEIPKSRKIPMPPKRQPLLLSTHGLTSSSDDDQDVDWNQLRNELEKKADKCPENIPKPRKIAMPTKKPLLVSTRCLTSSSDDDQDVDWNQLRNELEKKADKCPENTERQILIMNTHNDNEMETNHDPVTEPNKKPPWYRKICAQDINFTPTIPSTVPVIIPTVNPTGMLAIWESNVKIARRVHVSTSHPMAQIDANFIIQPDELFSTAEAKNSQGHPEAEAEESRIYGQSTENNGPIFSENQNQKQNPLMAHDHYNELGGIGINATHSCDSCYNIFLAERDQYPPMHIVSHTELDGGALKNRIRIGCDKQAIEEKIEELENLAVMEDHIPEGRFVHFHTSIQNAINCLSPEERCRTAVQKLKLQISYPVSDGKIFYLRCHGQCMTPQTHILVLRCLTCGEMENVRFPPQNLRNTKLILGKLDIDETSKQEGITKECLLEHMFLGLLNILSYISNQKVDTEWILDKLVN